MPDKPYVVTVVVDEEYLSLSVIRLASHQAKATTDVMKMIARLQATKHEVKHAYTQPLGVKPKQDTQWRPKP